MFHTLLVVPLVNLLFAIYAIIPIHDFGIAVILLTILVRLALWPLVNRQLHSQKAIQAMAPDVAKLRAKHKGNKQKETEALMALYKERGTNPFSSLLPVLIQLPIFFALYLVITDSLKAGELAKLAYEPLRQLAPIADIISHKVILSTTLLGLIDLTKPHIILSLLAGAAQYYQTKQLTPNPEHMDDQARMMIKFTKFFPILTIVVSLTLPSALALYWTFTSLVAILQQHLVLNRDAKEMKELPT